MAILKTKSWFSIDLTSPCRCTQRGVLILCLLAEAVLSSCSRNDLYSEAQQNLRPDEKQGGSDADGNTGNGTFSCDAGEDLYVAGGERITLQGQTDTPGGEKLQVEWRIEGDGSSQVSLDNPNSLCPTFTVPEKLVTIQCVLTVSRGSSCVEDSVYVHVDRVYIRSISLSCGSGPLSVGDSIYLALGIEPEGATEDNLVWVSENNGVVEVSDGQVTAISPGIATIRVVNPDTEIFGECTISVPMATTDGNSTTYRVADGCEIETVRSPDIPSAYFPTGTNDGGTAPVPSPFEISTTELSYDMWDHIRKWAEGNLGYVFANSGDQPLTGGPVTNISWRDSRIWCNALTEFYNYHNGNDTDLTPVYTDKGTILRDSTSSVIDSISPQPGASGFRLPIGDEWEFAARYRGTDQSIPSMSLDSVWYYTNGYCPSGISYNAARYIEDVAWFSDNASGTIHKSGSRFPNELGLYDMTGNLFEFIDDYATFTDGSVACIICGGCYSDNSADYKLAVGNRSRKTTTQYSLSSGGIRIVRLCP